MSFPNTFLTKAPCFGSRPGRNLGATILVALLVSCGQEDRSEDQIAPDFWEGNQTDFESGFSFQTKGNESVLHYENTGQPYSGSIERNASSVLTRQTFSSGKLNGLSTKHSKDGSRVGGDVPERPSAWENDFLLGERRYSFRYELRGGPTRCRSRRLGGGRS